MKITRKQLRKLIETKIKPSLEMPGLSDYAQKNLYTLADGRDQDSSGREFADRYLDSMVDSFPSQEGLDPYSEREFRYDYPLIEDPEFSKNISDLFDIFMYENKVFANDIEDGMSLEEYKDMARDFFMEVLPRMSTRPGYFTGGEIPRSIGHTFSSGKIPYQLEDIIKRIVDPISERIWNDWTGGTFFG